MSTATTTAASGVSTCHQQLYNIPTHDAACAMPKNSTYHTLMTSCCGSAAVTSYSDCDYYCLAQDQTVGDLAECLIKGSEAGMVWCNNGANATATITANATSSGSASETSTGSANATSTDDSSDPTGTNGADAGTVLSSKAVVMLAVLAFGSVATAFA